MLKSKMLSFVEAKNIAKSLKLNTLKEWSQWVVTNNHEHILPVDPRSYYKEFVSGADFLGYTQQEYRERCNIARVKNTDFKASGRKASATWAKRRKNAEKASKETPKPSPTKETTTHDYIETTEMVKFFIREDVDLKVILNFFSEFAHPKETYQLLLDHLKQKYTVSIWPHDPPPGGSFFSGKI